MADMGVAFDPSAPIGERFPSVEVRDEIGVLAPVFIADAAVLEQKIAANAVTTPKIMAGAVTSPKIANGGVDTVNLADGAVVEAKLDDGAVTGVKAGPGVVTCHDSAGNQITLDAVPITGIEYAALASKDPNTLYIFKP